VKKLFGACIFVFLFVSTPVFAEAPDCAVSVTSTEVDCPDSSGSLEKALLEAVSARHDAATARRDATHVYGLIGAMLIVCLLLAVGFLGRGRRIEELEDEIINQRVELGRLIQRDRADAEDGTPY